MDNNITRREFIEQVLPKKETIKSFSRIVKNVIYGLIAFTVLIALTLLPLSAWPLAFLVLTLLITSQYIFKLYRKTKEKLKTRPTLFATLEAIEKTVALFIHMGSGILIYKSWLKDPYEAYMLIVFFAIVTINSSYNDQR